MKQLIILIILVNLTTNVFSQQTREPKPPREPLTQKEYRARSKDQVVGGIVLVTAGSGLIILGASVQKDATGFDYTGLGLEALGIAAIAGSIPLFLISAHNHRKAKQLTVMIKTENTLAARLFIFSRQYFPAVSLKINL
jgi:FAD/FMN-containing dehydrogenase